MNAHDIDWTQAPEGYDYYIVDTHGKHEPRFHYLETDHRPLTDIFGEIYVDENGQNWVGAPDRLEIYKRPEFEIVSEGLGDTSEITHLRCVDTNDDESFSLGSVYEIVEDNTRGEDGHYLLRGDDNMTWAITPDTLEFAGCPEIGRFEDASADAYVGDSVQASDPTPKTQPEFGDIVHVQGKPYVFIRVDEDDDYHLIGSEGAEHFLDLSDIDEYDPTPAVSKLREQILYNLQTFTGQILGDHMAYLTPLSVNELIDFIIEHKDNWEL